MNTNGEFHTEQQETPEIEALIARQAQRKQEYDEIEIRIF